MQIFELLEKIGKTPLPPVLLLCPGKAPFNKEGWEPYLAERAVDKISTACVDPGMHDMAYTVFYADETQPAEVVMEAETMPFLAERRVIIVRNAGRYMKMSAEKKSPLVPLLAYLERPVETTLLVFVSSEVDRRLKFFTACKKAGAVVECPQLEDAALQRWVRDEVQRRDKQMDAAAVKELIHRAGSRLSDIHNALDLLLAYVAEAPKITEKDVIAACADVAEESVWNLTDAISKSDTNAALQALQQLLDFGKSPDEIMGTINWLLESAYRAAPESSLSVKSRFVEEKVRPLARNIGFARFKDAFDLCTRTQFMLRSTGVNKELALELLVIKLAADRTRKGRAARQAPAARGRA